MESTDGSVFVQPVDSTASGWKHVLWGGVDSSSNTTFSTSGTVSPATNLSGAGNSEGEAEENNQVGAHRRLLARLSRRQIDTNDVSLRENSRSEEASLGASSIASEKGSATTSRRGIRDDQLEGDVWLRAWRGICDDQLLPDHVRMAASPARSWAELAGSESAIVSGTAWANVSGTASQAGASSSVSPPLATPAPLASAVGRGDQPATQPVVFEEDWNDMQNDLRDLLDLIDEDDEGNEVLTATQDESNDVLTATRRQQTQDHQAIMNSLMANPGSLEEMLRRVPIGNDGAPTSIGSIGHHDGQCKGCLYVFTSAGCTNGITCSFCHFPHKRMKRKNKMRPCKGKRDRYRKLVIRLTQMIEADPDNFDLDQLELPPSIEKSEAVKDKLRKKMRIYADRVCNQRRALSAGREAPTFSWFQANQEARTMQPRRYGSSSQPRSGAVSQPSMHGHTLPVDHFQDHAVQVPRRTFGKGASSIAPAPGASQVYEPQVCSL